MNTLENKAEFVQGLYNELRHFTDAVLGLAEARSGTLQTAVAVGRICEAALLSEGQLHLGHGLPAGQAVGTAVDVQATVKLLATFTGVPSHAAGAPQEGRNALAACAGAVLGLLALPRSSLGTTNVNVGTMRGGDATNIVPAHAELTAEVRSDCAATCEDLVERARHVVEGSARVWDVGSDVRSTAWSTTLSSDDVLVDEVVRVAEGLFGADMVRRTAPMPASDDATLLAREVQRRGGLATYVIVGGGNRAPHHHPRFDIAEECLEPALRWIEAIVRAGGTGSVVRPA